MDNLHKKLGVSIMDSSWIKRWHRKDELEYSKGTTTEVSTVHEECQNLVAEVQERNLYYRMF